MILTPANQPKKVAILGAGISGLSLGWHLQKRFGKDIELSIFEAADRAGGWIQSHRLGDYFFERGARSFRADDCQGALELIEEMDLSGDLLMADPLSNHRFIYHQGALHRLPENLVEIFKTPLFRGCFEGLFNDLIEKKSLHLDESVYAFFSRRFSKSFAERLIDPIVKGIYAGDAKELSMKMCFPSVWEMEKMDRSLVKFIFKKFFKDRKSGERKGLFTLSNGLESLIKALASRMSKNLYFNSKVKSLHFEQERAYVEVNEQRKVFDYVISTLPAYRLKRLLKDEELGQALGGLFHASIGVVHFGYPNLVHDFKGFGYLVPSEEGEKILGVIFDSVVFPKQNLKSDETRLTVMFGGTSQRELFDLEEKEQIAIARKSIERHLGIKEPPALVHSSIAKDAIPQYPVGYSNQLERIFQKAEKLPRLLLLGTSFNGVSINQQIASAKKLAATVSLS